jgi:pyruvate dehydrogenase (quinone)
VDLQEQLVGDDGTSAQKVGGHTSDAWRPIVVPLEAVKAAANVLNAGKKGIILAGQGALGATDERGPHK